MDAATAQSLQILMLHKAMSNTSKTIDNSLLSSGPVVEGTVIQGHREMIQFGVIHSLHFPLLFDISWLTLYNLLVHW